MSYAHPPGLQIVDAMTPAVLMLTGPVTRDEVTGLCDDVRALLEATGARGPSVVVCDVGGLGPPGLGAVDLLARMELTARRAGGRIRLRDPDPALRALLDLVGLRFEVERQPEQREPALGVEEAVEPGDPAL
ncbi:STAS domain-containing protein [Streptomyces sp. NL15-2K]|uniref:STAS domain-containing protein n=1 Tax=Streptomyces sp. NL15-2K TaxID=376149 RepID=UPI000F567B62|nr:STAS domain-containing protein [Streptomyces sp. NL15-2K]